MSALRNGLALGLVVASFSAPAFAQSGFCEGFLAGWQSAFQNRRMIPGIPPICPIPRIGGDSYQAGYERGMLAALNYIAQH